MRVALQEHHHQLLEYLSEWGKKQQEILGSSKSLEDIEYLPAAQSNAFFSKLDTERSTEAPACPPIDDFVEDSMDPKMTRSVASGPSESDDGPTGKGGLNSEPHHPDVLQHLEQAFSHLRALGHLQGGTSNDESNHTLVGDGLSALESTLGQLKARVVAGCNTALHEVHDTFQGEYPDDPTTQVSNKTNSLLGDKAKLHQESMLLGVEEHMKPRPRRIFIKENQDGGIISRMVVNSKFEGFCAMVIFANAIVMGVSANYDMQHLHGPASGTLNNFEKVFCGFYTLEVSMRGWAGRSKYFFGSDWRWNWFDILLVFTGWYDQLEALLGFGGDANSAANISFLRIFRLLKTVKLLRMFRLMRMFRELRLILNSVLGCLRSLFWASCLLLIIAYMAGMCLLNGCTSYLQSTDDIDTQTRAAIQDNWGSVTQAMYSLFVSCTGGMDWVPIAEPLWDAGVFFWSLFQIYIVFFMFVVLNTLTSLFLDSMVDQSNRDHAMVIQMELEKKDEYILNLQEFFDEIDDDGNGTVSYDEFCKHAHDPKLHAFAASLDIDVLDAKQFFSILSNDGKDLVDIETFVVGCIKLKGNAKSTDLLAMFQAVKTMMNTVNFIAEKVCKDVVPPRLSHHSQNVKTRLPSQHLDSTPPIDDARCPSKESRSNGDTPKIEL